jgi:hypothetical protein
MFVFIQFLERESQKRMKIKKHDEKSAATKQFFSCWAIIN